MPRPSALLLLVAGLAASAVPAAARPRHRHRATTVPSGPMRPAAPAPFSFYPEAVDGGVAGNLPFNNQIRKHTDPLNANGSR